MVFLCREHSPLGQKSLYGWCPVLQAWFSTCFLHWSIPILLPRLQARCTLILPPTVSFIWFIKSPYLPLYVAWAVHTPSIDLSSHPSYTCTTIIQHYWYFFSLSLSRCLNPSAAENFLIKRMFFFKLNRRLLGETKTRDNFTVLRGYFYSFIFTVKRTKLFCPIAGDGAQEQLNNCDDDCDDSPNFSGYSVSLSLG